MEDEVLKHMHELHLILADELKRICDKYNITYFMIAGTLLGAVRHQGFIPWDDDMDFGMQRSEFQRFVVACTKELNEEKFYLQTDKNDKLYPFNFAKLRLKHTKVVEEFSSHVNTNQGIYIDIFPIDAVSDRKYNANLQLKQFWFYRNLLLIKLGYGTEHKKKKLNYKVGKLISKIYSIDSLKEKKDKVIRRCEGKETKFVVTSDGNYGLNKETLKSEWIKNICDYKFENKIYPGIKNNDEYLTYFYGNYMKLPETDNRNHHKRLDVEFGPYECR